MATDGKEDENKHRSEAIGQTSDPYLSRSYNQLLLALFWETVIISLENYFLAGVFVPSKCENTKNAREYVSLVRIRTLFLHSVTSCQFK